MNEEASYYNKLNETSNTLKLSAKLYRNLRHLYYLHLFDNLIRSELDIIIIMRGTNEFL